MVRKRKEDVEVVGFLGVGLDNADGHQRVTRSKHFVLFGGSEATHEQMQDTAIHFDEALDRRGKRLQDASVEEVVDLLHEAREASK